MGPRALFVIKDNYRKVPSHSKIMSSVGKGMLVLNTVSGNIKWHSLFGREFSAIYRNVKHA